MDIKPIETEYKGYLFRSRLEARYAVFFDALRVKWEYEPEGYEINGERYLPDFWLPTVTSRGEQPSGVFIEVKPPINMNERDEKKILAGSLYKPIYCFLGLPGPHYEMFNDSAIEYKYGHWCDAYMSFAHCPACNHVKIEFGEGNYFYCPDCGGQVGSETNRLLAAYKAAKQARFEHGQPWSER